ncbi:MAG: GTP cyclohydrolase I FolE2 [Coxiellaceae bacterium]|nr:GTP cyclohydrolase I FolE2 [Coxiellaceae bacterium]
MSNILNGNRMEISSRNGTHVAVSEDCNDCNDDTTPSNYEWLGDDELTGEKDVVAREIMGEEYSKGYASPIRVYDTKLEASKDYISSLPDLQNGPSSLIQGAPVAIQQVGIHNFRLPLTYKKRSGSTIELETSVTGSVSLEAHKKGINMSRIMRSFYDHKDETFSIDKIKDVLETYKENLMCFDSRIMLKISYPIRQKSLRSGLEGFQYYDVVFEGDLTKSGEFKKYIHFDFVYSSACPCSFELSEHAEKYRNRATVPHSQRSVARVSVRFEDMLWVEDLQELCLAALQTETQVMVKREDEQAFAELNGASLKFVEDAVRLLYAKLNNEPRILDFKIVASHNESLHSHNAVSVIVKGIEDGFSSGVARDVFEITGLR